MSVTSPAKQRTVYDAKHSQQLPGSVVRTEGARASADVSVNEAYDGFGTTFDFYLQAYHRNSIDDAGLPMHASVHFGSNYDNAFSSGQQMVFGDGTQVILRSSSALICAPSRIASTLRYDQRRKMVTAPNEPSNGLKCVYCDA